MYEKVLLYDHLKEDIICFDEIKVQDEEIKVFMA